MMAVRWDIWRLEVQTKSEGHDPEIVCLRLRIGVLVSASFLLTNYINAATQAKTYNAAAIVGHNPIECYCMLS